MGCDRRSHVRRLGRPSDKRRTHKSVVPIAKYGAPPFAKAPISVDCATVFATDNIDDVDDNAERPKFKTFGAFVLLLLGSLLTWGDADGGALVDPVSFFNVPSSLCASAQ